MAQSKELTEFYQAYKAWLDAGAPKNTCFTRYNGLCHSLLEWCFVAEWSIWHDENRQVDTVALKQEFKQQLRDAFTDSEFPFGGEEVYDDETDLDTAHLNPARIAWVEAHVNG